MKIKISFTLNGINYEMSMNEARELYNELGKIFSNITPPGSVNAKGVQDIGNTKNISNANTGSNLQKNDDISGMKYFNKDDGNKYHPAVEEAKRKIQEMNRCCKDII